MSVRAHSLQLTCCSGSSLLPTNAGRWPFEQWGHFLPEQTTAVSILDRLPHHATVVVTSGESHRMKDREAPTSS